MRVQEPVSIPEAICGMMNAAYEWTLDGKTAHIPKPPKKPTRLSVKVPLPGEAVTVKVVMNLCRECAGITGIEDGRKAYCPYCGGELMEMEGEG
jgi:hypothetical protein